MVRALQEPGQAREREKSGRLRPHAAAHARQRMGHVGVERGQHLGKRGRLLAVDGLALEFAAQQMGEAHPVAGGVHDRFRGLFLTGSRVPPPRPSREYGLGMLIHRHVRMSDFRIKDKSGQTLSGHAKRCIPIFQFA
ncbi:hypothetical protein MTBUT4_60157 [Magnetospirillum sp. UT-4]|nr:hypothetical protein MTBUT4_60157 [Magnetospirillum sp. UT-4]